MKSDFDMIVTKLPETEEKVHIYPVGDCQVGSANFSQKLFIAWRNRVLADPIGKVLIVGDMFNNGLKASKTNVYREVMNPSQAKDWLETELLPIADRILGAVTGNHEKRSVRETDSCPLYEVMCRLRRADVYRENMAFIKLNIGLRRNKERQISYQIVIGHGVSKNKTDSFGYAIDGMDIFITGHTHDAKSAFPAKIVIDPHNELVRVVGYTQLRVPSFDLYGGYVLEGMYMPHDGTKIPMLELSGKSKEVTVHWIQEKF